MSKYSTNEKASVEQRQVTVVGVDWIEVCGQVRRARCVRESTGRRSSKR